MSSLPHESFPSHPEVEPVVTLPEARTEVTDTIESVISAAIDKAIKMDIGGIKTAADSLRSREEMKEEQTAALSANGKRLVNAISSVRLKGTLIAEGLRDDATNSELVSLVDWLAGHNEICKAAFDNEDLAKINNTGDLINVIDRSMSGIQGKLSVGLNPLLSDAARKELASKFPPQSD